MMTRTIRELANRAHVLAAELEELSHELEEQEARDPHVAPETVAHIAAALRDAPRERFSIAWATGYLGRSESTVRVALTELVRRGELEELEPARPDGARHGRPARQFCLPQA